MPGERRDVAGDVAVALVDAVGELRERHGVRSEARVQELEQERDRARLEAKGWERRHDEGELANAQRAVRLLQIRVDGSEAREQLLLQRIRRAREALGRADGLEAQRALEGRYDEDATLG